MLMINQGNVIEMKERIIIIIIIIVIIKNKLIQDIKMYF
jgi:hypothetical protein